MYIYSVNFVKYFDKNFDRDSYEQKKTTGIQHVTIFKIT